MAKKSTDSYQIYKGDTGPVIYLKQKGNTTAMDGNWSCQIKVYSKLGTTALIDRAVTDKTGDNVQYIAALTPTETDTLAPGDYVMIVELVNATLVPPFHVQSHAELKILDSGA